MSVRSPT